MHKIMKIALSGCTNKNSFPYFLHKQWDRQSRSKADILIRNYILCGITEGGSWNVGATFAFVQLSPPVIWSS